MACTAAAPWPGFGVVGKAWSYALTLGSNPKSTQESAMPNTTQAIQITAYGGPEQMRVVDLPVGEPGAGIARRLHQRPTLAGL